jgi:hypothetical protein
MRPIIDLYFDPPTDGPVWCLDEKTSIQALQRRHPELPLRRPGERIKREAELQPVTAPAASPLASRSTPARHPPATAYCR